MVKQNNRPPVPPPLPEGTSLAGRSLLITGSTAGLGYAAALMALQLGASPVYITARNASKGIKSKEQMLADPIVKAKNPRARVEIYDLDMARWEGPIQFAEKFIKDREEKGEKLDIAILNAGMAAVTYEAAPTGNEMVIQVNYLSTALLALLLLPLLKKSTTPEHTARLMIVSSTLHSLRYGGLTECLPPEINYLHELNDPAQFAAMERYGQSKLLVMWFVRHLASRVSPDEVIINDVCPGAVNTSINDRMPMWMWPILYWKLTRVAHTPEDGARSYIYAVACVGKESHGQWYQCSHWKEYGDFCRSAEGQKMQEKEWKETMEVLEKVRPGISKIVPA